MTDPTILFVKPNAISDEDKTLLREAGIIVVSIDDPADAKFVRAHSEISGGEMLIIACDVLAHSSSGGAREAFGKAICEAIVASQTSRGIKGD